MSSPFQSILYKLVLTGGPCGGKTSASSRLGTFFETLGWKVYRVPETATVLLSGGVMFPTLTLEEANKFQENLLKTMLKIEDTFFELGRTCKNNCLIVCDRGAMDASIFMPKEDWDAMLQANNLNAVDLINRYDHIIRMISAADGAEDFYTIEGHTCRYQDIETAKELDTKYPTAWQGHPCFDVIDNSTDFERKINRLIACVCQRIGIEVGDRLKVNSRKRTFLVKMPLPPHTEFLDFEDIEIVQNFLKSDPNKATVWLRNRYHKGRQCYIHTVERVEPSCDKRVAVQTNLSRRDYVNMLPQKDDAHFTIFIKRRCFVHNNRYYQLDIYRQPTHLKQYSQNQTMCQLSSTGCQAMDSKCQTPKARCQASHHGLVILETYTTAHEDNLILSILPRFLTIEKEITNDPAYSLINLSLKPGFKTSRQIKS